MTFICLPNTEKQLNFGLNRERDNLPSNVQVGSYNFEDHCFHSFVFIDAPVYNNLIRQSPSKISSQKSNLSGVFTKRSNISDGAL